MGAVRRPGAQVQGMPVYVLCAGLVVAVLPVHVSCPRCRVLPLQAVCWVPELRTLLVHIRRVMGTHRRWPAVVILGCRQVCIVILTSSLAGISLTVVSAVIILGLARLSLIRLPISSHAWPMIARRAVVKR